MRKQYPAPSASFQTSTKLLIILEHSKDEYEQRPEVIKYSVERDLNSIFAKVIKNSQKN